MNKKTKIPKIIHYCWFGKGKKSELIEKCIASWKKYLPDYKIIEWNESNFDINSNIYCKEAYENKKYAFVSDYVRLYAVYNYGGIYFDTDLEVLKKLDCFLDYNAFTGFEGNDFSFTAVFGARKKSKWIERLLNYYSDRHFVLENGKLDTTPNTEIVHCINIKDYKLIPNNTYQELSDFVIFPNEYFSPKNWKTGEINLTKNTYTIHHFNASWKDKYDKKLAQKQKELIKKYGNIDGEKKYQSYFKKRRLIIMFKRALKNPKLITNKFRRK